MSDSLLSSGVSTTLAQLQAASAGSRAAAAAARPRAVEQVAQEFEALFLSEMLKPVFESTDTEGLFGGGEGEKIFRSMMVQEYGKAIAKSGGVGIAAAVQSEILRMQENQQ